MEGQTRILVFVETRETLKALKRGGETYDAVIRRLVKEAKGR
jgi:predicted CopG family antitoxin